MKKVDLSVYNSLNYQPGAKWKRSLWYLISVLFFINPLSFSYGLKRSLLRIFGAKIEKGVIIKPRVHIKYPWFLEIGKNSWIGEGVWIDNLAKVSIGDNVCLSQGVVLQTGNHDYQKKHFDLIIKGIHIKSGAWIGSFGIIAPGVKVGTHAVLTIGSVATSNLMAYSIYKGNPAQKIRQRKIAST